MNTFAVTYRDIKFWSISQFCRVARRHWKWDQETTFAKVKELWPDYNATPTTQWRSAERVPLRSYDLKA